MSNALALATVTSAIRYVLERALAAPHPGPVGGAAVTTLRPDRLGSGDLAVAAGLNVFLYRVTPNAAGNLLDLPTRRDDGSFVRRPVAALDLHYLITGYGGDASLDGQRLLGRALTALALTPVLTPEVVAAAVEAYADDPDTAFLAQADLAEQREPVRLAVVPLPLEDLSRLWSAAEAPYELSVACTATVVLLESEVATSTALPVRVRGLTVSPAGVPRLLSVAPLPAEDGSGPAGVGPGTVLVLRGSGLLPPAGAVPRVRVGPALLPPEPGSTSAEVRVVLTDEVPAGVHALRLQHRRAAGPAGPERVLATSGALPVQVAPTVEVDEVTATTVVLAVAPPLQPGQRASVQLARTDGDEDAPVRVLSVELDPVPRDAPARSSVALDRAGLPEGRWLVRLRVDGVDSVPELVDGRYAAPVLELG